MMNFPQIKSAIDSYILKNGFDSTPKELYLPLDYIIKIGGKRLRPISLLLANQMFDGDFESSLPAAYAVELFHNFSLIHDDIMDEAPLRRGNETVHTKWDTNTAILSGDAMLIYSYQYLNRSCHQHNGQLIHNIFGETAIKVCEGQQLDVNYETQYMVSLDEYISMIYKKTGALIEGAMRIGAALAGAQEKEIDLIGSFAKQIGISFQLQDDILDAYGEKANVGKQIGGDIIQNKKTILYLLAIKHGSASQQNKLDSLFTESELDKENKVSEVMTIFNNLGVKEKAESIRDEYHQAAFRSINRIQAPQPAKQPMIDFVDQLLVRSF